MGRRKSLKMWQWLVIGGVLALSIIPDPTDVLDFFLPVIEPTIASLLYLRWRGGV